MSARDGAVFVKVLTRERTRASVQHEMALARAVRTAQRAGASWSRLIVPVLGVHAASSSAFEDESEADANESDATASVFERDEIVFARAQSSLSDLLLSIVDEDDEAVGEAGGWRFSIPLALARSVLSSLRELQSSVQFVHNDLRTDNVLVSSDGGVWVADLEVCTLRAGDRSLARSDLQQLSERSDVWGRLYGHMDEHDSDRGRASADAQLFVLDVIAHVVVIATRARSFAVHSRARQFLQHALPAWARLSGVSVVDSALSPESLSRLRIDGLDDAYDWLEALALPGALTSVGRPRFHVCAVDHAPDAWLAALSPP